MENLDWGLELLLVGLLVVTLVHAVRLERALRLMRSDRVALGEAIAGFDDSARQAEAGIDRLHSASAETVQNLAQRVEKGSALRDDLTFLIDRGEALADRLDSLVRAGRLQAASMPTPMPSGASVVSPPSQIPPALTGTKVRSQAERDLLLALQGTR